MPTFVLNSTLHGFIIAHKELRSTSAGGYKCRPIWLIQVG
jgi:hypothetical protein